MIPVPTMLAGDTINTCSVVQSERAPKLATVSSSSSGKQFIDETGSATAIFPRLSRSEDDIVQTDVPNACKVKQ